MSGSPPPPRWAERLVALLAPERVREELLGDLREGYARRADDPRRARAWYGGQLLRTVVPALRMRLRSDFVPSDDSGHTMESLIHDLRYGLRSLWRSPTFATVATLTLALAIGVNTAIFSIVSVVVFADLPMQDAETVSIVRAVNPELGVDQGSLSVPDYLDLAERAESFESLAALTEDQWVLTGLDRPQRVTGYRVTANILRQWRLPPVLGRDFAGGEDREGAGRVVMLSYPFWQSQFGGERDVLGRTLRL
ncbi:MAG: hypothetical protein GWM92_22190, partial [Gemmatimonadetes bacterium]|nr:hypothetical protein [Gemmatimonadota bacterium]NIR81578.1 hypothetical protein [Gemmatimonadota bacterium]NIT90419.1 hypothetical protein [Gemmatimonadota bacterium]NIU34253.1 hypothetical protein [Gemmatimonadota bacterium]NIU38381.1 hypothetical protein [Gemmatimonadota bacterium]